MYKSFNTLLLLGVSAVLLAALLPYLNSRLLPHFTDDPHMFVDTCQLAVSNGFQCESHLVTTADGYRLTLHRVVSGRSREGPPALALHCLECDSAVFATNLPDQSLAFILAQAGVDVWLGNFRGTIYGNTHQRFSKRDDEFWDFTWQDMAEYDLPASIDYVLATTGQPQLSYIGHSQGTLTAFAMMATNATAKSRISTAYMLSPFVTLRKITSPIAYFLDFMYLTPQFVDDKRITWFEPPILNYLAAYFCRGVTLPFCTLVYHQFSGYSSPDNLNSTRVLVYFTHALSGTSVKNVKHYAQLHVDHQFRKYDYHSEQANLHHYNRTSPPQYDISQVTVPVALYSGALDWLVSAVDVQYLVDGLPNLVLHNRCHNFAHLDFIWGLHANECAYWSIRDSILHNWQSR